MTHTYLDHLKPRFEFLLSERKFKIRDSDYPPRQFDDFYIDLESKDFFFRLLNDRGYCRVLISPTSDPEDWYDIGLFNTLIRGSAVPRPANLDEEAEFIRLYYEAIRDSLSETNFQDTKNRLRQIGRERMRNRRKD